MTRVLVVGGGIAGCAAALAARRAGAEVVVVRRAPGATALYAGGMELGGELRGLAEREPWHPLGRLGMDHVQLAAALDSACSELLAALGRAGLQLSGHRSRPGLFADLHGAARPGHLVPLSVRQGELGGLRGRRLAVVGVAGVGEYDAAATAAALRTGWGVDAVAVEVDMGLPPGASLTDLFGSPAPEVEGGADLVAFPPGLEALPGNGFELLAAPPSPHGLRLQRALEAALAEAGVGVVAATAGPVTTGPGGLVTQIAGIEADQFVLASGRFIGGGIRRARSLEEPVFGLTVFHEGRPVDEVFGHRLRHLLALSPEPMFRCGLMSDPELRPLAGATVAHPNLRVAGAVLGGYDYGREWGFGVPILTGWLAGRGAAA